MEKAGRVLVHLCKDGSVSQCARFLQSIVGHLADPGTDQTEVRCSLEDSTFVLYRKESNSGATLLPLKRAPFCPFKHMSDSQAVAIPAEVRERGVDVGVAVLLQSHDQRLLLTRRAAQMRIFPNVWVPPGGHIEFGEKLLDTGLRELGEETGLKLDPEEVSAQLLALWESAYPPALSKGLPCRHHIVTYMLLLTSLTHQQLQAALHPDPTEVSACVWLDTELARAIVAATDGEDVPVSLPPNLPATVRVTAVSPEGRLSGQDLPTSVLCRRASADGEDVERVSTGTKFALEVWLKTLDSPE